MVGWHRRLNGHEFEQTPGNGEGQASLACCSPWGRKESDTTERLNISKDRILGWWGVCFQHFFIPPSSYLHGFRGEVGCNSYLSSCVGTVFSPTPLATLKVFSLFLVFCLNVVLCIYLLCSLIFLSCYEEHTVYISHGCFPFIKEKQEGCS